MNYEKLTDVQLVRWVIKFGGWTYSHYNDQLRDTQGFMSSTDNWKNIGVTRREQIIELMQSLMPDQIKQI